MAQKNGAQIKGYFLTGAFPTQQQFEDFIDSKQQTLETNEDEIIMTPNEDGSVKMELKYKTVVLTKAEYEALEDRDDNTIYYLTD